MTQPESDLEFLTTVSHEMRSPLSTVLGIALTLERAGDQLSQEEVRDLVSRLVAGARKLDQLLTDLLDVDRLQRGRLQPDRAPTDLAKLVEQAVEESGLAQARPVEVEAEPLVLAVDAVQIERVVANLISNSARHTPAGTPVWVRLRRDDEGKGDGALLIVEDAGPGVPAELAETIFQPFRQAGDPGGNGIGVGLSLVARFAELHGGRAWVQDRPGGGASFRVWLPAPSHDGAATR